MGRNISKGLLLGVFFSPLIHAGILEDTTFVASISYQDKELSFDQRYSGATINNNQAKFSTNLPMVNFGFTAVYDRFFTVIKYETNLAETSATTNETNRSENLETNLLTHPGGTIDVKRTDLSFTLGYNVAEGVNVFFGFLDGETELSPDPFCGNYISLYELSGISSNPFITEIREDPNDSNSPIVAYNTVCPTGNRAIQQFFTAQELPEGESLPRYRQTYEEKGPFVGASYTTSIRDLGSISFSFAYAKMNGSYEDNASDPYNIWGDNFETFDYEGDSTGTSIAATWTSALGESSAYFIDVRRQAYSMTGNDVTGRLEGVVLKTDEEMVGITGGIQFYF